MARNHNSGIETGASGSSSLNFGVNGENHYSSYDQKPPSQSWRTFSKNHAQDIISVHFNVTDSPTALWTGQQIIEAFPWDTAPRYMIRDRDKKFGDEFTKRVTSLDIKQVLIAARSPWQNPYVERMIGSIRRDCLDHTIIFNERHLRRVLKEYIRYYNENRTHLGLEKDCPDPRAIEFPDSGPVQSEPMAGGLHHRYFRQAA